MFLKPKHIMWLLVHFDLHLGLDDCYLLENCFKPLVRQYSTIGFKSKQKFFDFN